MPLEPQFFDIFGFIGFSYITMLALWGLFGKKVEKWMWLILLLIGVLGLLIDGSIVNDYYLNTL